MFGDEAQTLAAAAAAAAPTCRDYPAVRTRSRGEAQVRRMGRGDEVREWDGIGWGEGRENCMKGEETSRRTGETWEGNLERKGGGTC